MVGLRGDQIGTMRMLTDANGVTVRRVVMTVFGEPVFDSQSQPGAPAIAATRYQYAGAWGYEALGDGDFPYLHVGERWYDPSTGRFLQRDRVGIRAGSNAFRYVSGLPTRWVDPAGLGFWDGNNWFHDAVARYYWLGLHSDDYVNSGWATAEAWGGSILGGTCIGHFLVAPTIEGFLPAQVANFVRFEAHHIGGLCGRMRYWNLVHMNVGDTHVILDPRFWFSRFYH